jgi:hypothetical protein
MNDKTTIPKPLWVLLPPLRVQCMQTMFALLLLLCATHVFSQTQWTEVKLPEMPRDKMYMPYRLAHMEWADSLYGYIFAQYKGYYLKTTDGGGTWGLDSLPPTPDSLHQRYSWDCSGVEFKDRNFGVVSYKGVWCDSLLFYTTDGGATWGYNPVKLPSRFKNTMNPPGSQLRVDANRALFLYYTRQYDDSVIANVVTRSDDYGATWRELGADTLYPETQYDRDNYRRYVLLDSLTHYSFTTRYNLGEFVGSWARISTDGGRQWKYPEPDHPLAQIGSFDIASVRVHRDTTIAMTLDQRGLHGACIGIVSTDVQQHLTSSGWYLYVHPFGYSPLDPGKLVDDNLYDEGTHIVRMADTVVVFRENPPERALKIRTPSHVGQATVALYLQPRGRLCYLATRGLWVLDYSTLGSVGAFPAPSPDIEGFECYPQPFSRSSGVLTLRMNSKQRHEGVTLALYDATGRRLFEQEIRDIAPGRSEVHLDLSDAPLSQLPSNSVLFIELRAQNQRFYTKSLFLNNNK